MYIHSIEKLLISVSLPSFQDRVTWQRWVYIYYMCIKIPIYTYVDIHQCTYRIPYPFFAHAPHKIVNTPNMKVYVVTSKHIYVYIYIYIYIYVCVCVKLRLRIKFRTCCACTCKRYVGKHSQLKWQFWRKLGSQSQSDF